MPKLLNFGFLEGRYFLKSENTVLRRSPKIEFSVSRRHHLAVVGHGKNGFITATKLGTTNEFFVASTENFAAVTKRFVDRTKHFVVVTKHFCYPYFNK